MSASPVRPQPLAWHSASDVKFPLAACTQWVFGEPVHVKRLMHLALHSPKLLKRPFESGMHFLSGVPVHVYLPAGGGEGGGGGGGGPGCGLAPHDALQAAIEVNRPFSACVQ